MLAAKGDKAEVERQMKTLAERDLQFLKDLTAPYLKGIFAHAISVAGSPSAKEGREPVPTGASPPIEHVMHKLRQNFGNAGEGQGSSSARHTESIHKLIKAQASKRKEK